MSARRWTCLAGAGSTALGVRLPSTPVETPWRSYWPLFLVAGLLVLWLVWGSRPRRSGRRAGGGRVRSVLRSAWSAMSPWGGSSAARVGRMQERSRRNRGLASGWSVLRRASGLSLRLRAGVLRPSLAGRLWVRALWVGTPLARVGRLLRVWSSCEDVTLRVGGPRMGKSGELACRVLDAPGAVIATSTRTDLYQVCAPVLRGARMLSLCNLAGLAVAALLAALVLALGVPGCPALVLAVLVVVPVSALGGPRRREPVPVLVFNPSGVGGLASTVAFNPLTGCEVPKTAIERAGDLLQGAGVGATSGGSEERKFWSDQARRALAALMHAAALGGGSMRNVQEWLSDPDEHARTVERYLSRSPSRALEQDAIQFFSTNHTTRSSITTTAMPALAWLADELAAACTEPVNTDTPVEVERVLAGRGEGRIELDVEWMLRERAALFMIGAEEAQTAPLLTALTMHIGREQRRIAALQPGGRLDPPLTYPLDEAALICTPPLERWTADMGGAGGTLHIGVQSFAQLVAKYGRANAATILNNCSTLVVFGGTKDPEDLNIYATLVGERLAESPGWDEHGAGRGFGTRMEPVLSKSQIAGLPETTALILKNKMAPMVGRVRMAWKRPDVKAVQRAARWQTQLAVVDRWAVKSRTATVGRLQGSAARREVTARQRRAQKRGL